VQKRSNLFSTEPLLSIHAKRNVYRSLLALVASATPNELARDVRYLAVENQILRSKM
jgi:hypothetical protein